MEIKIEFEVLYSELGSFGCPSFEFLPTIASHHNAQAHAQSIRIEIVLCFGCFKGREAGLMLLRLSV